MINLLPDSLKQQQRYSKYNRQLSLVLILMVITIAIIFSSIQVAKFIATSRTDTFQDLAEQSQAQLAELEPKLQEVRELDKKLDTIDQLFEKESRYSNFINELAGVIPPWARLNAINLVRATANDSASEIDESKLDINFIVGSAQEAAILRENLNSLARVDFVDILSISEDAELGVTNVTYTLSLNTPAYQLLEEPQSE